MAEGQTLPTERGPERTSALRAMREEDDQSLKEWFDGMGGETSLRIQIVRKKPMVARNGDNIAGILETVEDRVDEDYVRDQWGGGTFQLKAYKQNAAGNWAYVRARSITLAGPPKMGGVPCGDVGGAAAPVVASPSDEIADRALSAMERATQRAEQRVDRLEQESRKGSGTDLAALEAVLRPIRDQLQASQDENRALRERIFDQGNRPPPKDEFRDRVLEKMIDGESARVESLRSQYEARIDRLRDSHEDQVKRLEGRHADDLRRLEAQHNRAVDQAQKSADDRLAAQKLGYDARIDSLKSEIGKLERELASAQTRTAQLEARKDQTIGEKAEELVKVREALDGIGGGKDDDASRAWYEKLIDAAGNSEALLALVNKIGGAAGATGAGANGQPQVQPQLPPPGVPFRTPDGQVWMVGPDGQPRPITPQAQAQLQQRARLAAARKKKRDAAANPPAAGANPPAPDAQGGQTTAPTGQEGDGDGVIDEALDGIDGDPGRPPDAGEVKIAITFMENAAQNGTDPRQFASSMRSLVPQDIVRFIHRVGVDQFLNSVVEPGSILTTQRGRNFVRSAFKVLIEG